MSNYTKKFTVLGEDVDVIDPISLPIPILCFIRNIIKNKPQFNNNPFSHSNYDLFKTHVDRWEEINPGMNVEEISNSEEPNGEEISGFRFTRDQSLTNNGNPSSSFPNEGASIN